MLLYLSERDPEGLSGVSCIWIKAPAEEIPSIKSTQEQQPRVHTKLAARELGRAFISAKPDGRGKGVMLSLLTWVAL